MSETSKLLRALILRAYSDAEQLPWPPTADDLSEEKMIEQLPNDFIKSLSFVISGEGDIETICPKTKRVILSIGQVSNNDFNSQHSSMS